MATAAKDDLDELEDDLDDDRMLEAYRQLRLQQMKLDQVKKRFGDVHEIKKADWIAEVTEASKSCTVVIHLYSDSVIQCELMGSALEVLAGKFREVKFLKIRSTQAIENWPDRNLPSLFVYRSGELSDQVLTLNELGGNSMTADGIYLIIIVLFIHSL